ncbi:amino acid adenylation domain-containing protein, partial [Pseudoalteromonas sp. L23]|uniref:non-ribosomal peptide synthetase n=1 Tax=unclassified Pseudoalteromonas TaxID=194690 RepID=UPI001EF0E6FA
MMMDGQKQGSTCYLALSLTQRDIYLDQQQYLEHPLYNVGGYIKLGAIDESRIKAAHEKLVINHEIFGMRVRQSESGISQYFSDSRLTNLEVLDFSAYSTPLEHATVWLQQRFAEAFQLEEQPLYDAYLVKLSVNEYWYVAIAHHVMMDGWGFANWADLLSQYYRGQDPQHQSKMGLWAEIVADDENYVASLKYQRDREFWLEQGITPQARVFNRTHKESWRQQHTPSNRIQLDIPTQLHKSMVARAKAWGVSVAQLVLAGVSIYFSKAYQLTELNIGLSFHNRNGAKQKRMLGAFTSISPTTLNCAGEKSLLELVKDIANRQKKCFRHQRFPFGHLVNALGSSGKENQLFDIAFNYLKLDSSLNFENGTESLEYVSHLHEITPVTVTYWEYGEELSPALMLDHNLAYFNEIEGIQLLERLMVVMQEITLQSAETPVSDIEILSAEDQQRFALLKNTPIDELDTEQALLHQQIALHSNNLAARTAVIAADQTISYAELERRADAMAQHLLMLGVKRQDRVLVYQQRSIALIVNILAIMKVAAVYVPCDMALPLARLQVMVADADPVLCLSDNAGLANLKNQNNQSLGCTVINSDDLTLEQYEYQQVSIPTKSDDLAYLMYTSGSTGKPKGVMVEYRQLAAFILPLQHKYSMTAGKRVLQFASLSFDTAIEEIFVALVHGGTLVLRSETCLGSADAFWQFCQKYEINLLSLPTAFWHRLAVELDGQIPSCIELIILGGEALAVDKVRKWLNETNTTARLINSYGPTETTVSACCFEIEKNGDIQDRVPIGRADPNTQLYILDSKQRPLPFGVPGEIYIGGSKVTRGYWQRPDLTARTFFADPWQNQPDARMYKSGDIGRFRSDGNIEYLGRNNKQVKIRGHRVELGEIENHIKQISGVDSVIVVLDSSASEAQLNAYVKAVDNKTEELLAQIKRALALELPSYMIPSGFMLLEQWPISANGKIDLKALPQIALCDGVNSKMSLSEMELRVASIWSELLNVSIAKLAPESDFFALGGHSLLAVSMLSGLKREFKVDINLATLFRASTIAALTEQLNAASQATENLTTILPQPSAERYPLSMAQLRLWSLDQLQGGSCEYNMLAAFEFSEHIDIHSLNKALIALATQHEILRTNLVQDGSSVVQVISAPRDDYIRVIDYSQLTARDYQLARQRYIQEQQEYNFELGRDTLFNVDVLLQSGVGDDKVKSGTLVINLHHIIADGWSVEIFCQALATAYQLALQKKEVKLPELPIQYKDYALWQRDRENSDELAQQYNYWQSQLAHLPTTAYLNVSKRAEQRGQQGQYSSRISDALKRPLEAQLKDNQMTPFMLVHGVLALLLARHSNSTDIVVGTAAANRLTIETQGLIGFFVNILVLRTQVEDTLLTDFFAQIKDVNRQAQANQEASYEELVRRLAPEQGRNLFQIMLTQQQDFEQGIAPEQLFLSGTNLSLLQLHQSKAKFDLHLEFSFDHKTLCLNWYYDQNCFDHALIESLDQHFWQLLRSLLSNHEGSTAQLEMLTQSEQDYLIHTLNQAQIPYPINQSVSQRFESIALKYADKVAVIAKNKKYSYEELNHLANQFAHTLVEKYNVTSGMLVGLHVSRSVEMLVSMLAILKVGGAYVPLDSNQPQQRLENIVTDAQLSLVITEPSLSSTLTFFQGTKLLLCDGYLERLIDTAKLLSKPAISVPPEQVAYVIYTSGSTGKPKGVLTSQQGILRLVCDAEYFPLNSMTQVLHCANIAFDAATFEIWGPLLNGGTSVVYPEKFVTPEQINQQLALWQINTLWLTAGLFSQWAQSLPEHHALENVIAGGDVLDVAAVKLCQQKLPEVQLWNGYGPTENTTFTTCHLINEVAPTSIPIGKALPGDHVYILQGDRLAPFGAEGELCVGGHGLALGYLNQDEMTRERFVENPFYSEGSTLPRMIYRTGDYVRYISPGVMAFIGRVDQQVKIRGFRVELDEVRSCLNQFNGVASSLVVLQQGAIDKQLVAYVQPINDTDKQLVELLRVHLQQQLPSYMVPEAIVIVADWPLTQNGKIDRERLPKPKPQIQTTQPPITPTEIALAELWADKLGIVCEAVGRDSSFFGLGGHSLSLIKMATAVATYFNIDFSAAQAYQFSTLSSLAQFIDSAALGVNKAIIIEPRDSSEPAALSYAQQRLWFIEQMQPGSAHYVMSSTLQLRGVIAADYIEQALQGIIARHDILRSRFISHEGEPRQVVESEVRFVLQHYDLTSLAPATQQHKIRALQAEEGQRGFDLTAGQLFRASLVRQSATEAVLMISLHHIIADGWSVEILRREFAALYQGLQRGEAAVLPPLAIQYSDYADWQQQQGKEVLQPSVDYWLEQLTDLPQRHDLPCDGARPTSQSFACKQVGTVLLAQQAEQLKTFAQQQEMTLFMLLHGALGMLLSRHSNNRDIVIGSPVANRLSSQVEPLIGCFINNVVLRLDCHGEQSVADFCQQIRAVNQDAQAHQAVPFEKLVEQLQTERSQAHAPLFQIMLNLHSQRQASLDLADITITECQPEALFSEYDLTFNAFWQDSELVINLVYNQQLFSESRANTLLVHLARLLMALVHAPVEQNIGLLSLLTEHEQADLIRQGQGPCSHIPQQTVITLLQQAGQCHPNAIAVRCLEQQLDYKQLFEHAKHIAQGLRQVGVKRGQRVGVCLPRTIMLLPTLLGVWQVGAAYVPLDPEYPNARLTHMINDSGACLVISESSVCEQLPSTVPYYDVEQLLSCAGSLEWEAERLESGACAYVIYTSGSTGQPKGVMVSHHNAVNFLTAMAELLSASSDTKLLAVTPISFDIHVLELFLPLLVGGTVYLADNAMRRDPGALISRLHRGDINMMQATPASWKMLLAEGRWQPISGLTILCGGEALDNHLSKALQAQGEVLWNLYGPTETTVWSAASKVTSEQVTVGRAIANTQLYVLSDSYQLQPHGCTGELYIGGEGVSLGYLGQEALTATRFITGIAPDGTARPLYRTGDLARLTVSGEFEVIGRADHQVKVRGHRIELGEIEQQLLALPSVREAVVLVVGEEEQSRLVAYIVSDKEDSHGDIQQQLATVLPEYMVPKQVVTLPRLPLTPNGKVDRSALPSPHQQATKRITATSQTERRLVQICAELLGIEAGDIGLEQHFFALGGHSLLSVKLQAEIRSTFAVELGLGDIFAQPDLVSLAATIDAAEHSQQTLITKRSSSEPAVLSYAQQRLWFIEQMQPGSAHYVMSSTLQLRGVIAADYIEQALQGII